MAILRTVDSRIRAMIHCFLQECGPNGSATFYRLYEICAEMVLLTSMLRCLSKSLGNGLPEHMVTTGYTLL